MQSGGEKRALARISTPKRLRQVARVGHCVSLRALRMREERGTQAQSLRRHARGQSPTSPPSPPHSNSSNSALFDFLFDSHGPRSFRKFRKFHPKFLELYSEISPQVPDNDRMLIVTASVTHGALVAGAPLQASARGLSRCCAAVRSPPTHAVLEGSPRSGGGAVRAAACVDGGGAGWPLPRRLALHPRPGRQSAAAAALARGLVPAPP